MTTFHKLHGGSQIRDRSWPRMYPWEPGQVVTSDSFTRPVFAGYLTDATLGGGRWPYSEADGFAVEEGLLRASGAGSVAIDLPPHDCLIEYKISHRPAAAITSRVWVNYIGSKARFDYVIRLTDSRIHRVLDGATTVLASGLPEVTDGTTVGLRCEGKNLTVSLNGNVVGSGSAGSAYPDSERRIFEIFTGGASGDTLDIEWLKITSI